MDGLTEGRIVRKPPEKLSLSIPDLAYVAGIIDGEGCISIDKATNQGKEFPRFQLKINITIREGNLLYDLAAVFGGSVRYEKRENSNHADVYRWRINSNKAAHFLQSVYPYLRLKKEQAFWGLHFQALMTRKGGQRTQTEALIQQDHYMLIRQMNKKGVTKWKEL